MPQNVKGENLQPCCFEPLTGFYRDGYCRTGPGDHGVHTVCVVVNQDFLKFSASVGNDLSTPMPEYGFPGLSPGDHWCLCASRWLQAYFDGMAPPVRMEATDIAALDLIRIDVLQQHAFKANH